MAPSPSTPLGSENEMATSRRPLWQLIAVVYALAVFAVAAGLKFAAFAFGWGC